MDTSTILVVEDNSLNLKLFRSLLTMSGYRVMEAEDAEKGIILASLYLPDLILMDIQLPGIDGLEATRKIKEKSETQKIPVVALTSYAMPGDESGKPGRPVVPDTSPNRSTPAGSSEL